MFLCRWAEWFDIALEHPEVTTDEKDRLRGWELVFFDFCSDFWLSCSLEAYFSVVKTT